MPYIPRDPFVLKLWLLDFEFIAETKLAHVFRRGDCRITIPKVEHLDAQWAREQLERCKVERRTISELLAA